MSKVKPQIGQIWNIGGHINRDEREIIEISDGSVWWSGNSYTPIIDFCDEDFEFIPQSDLEWLAVNESEWGGDDKYPLIYRDRYDERPDYYLYDSGLNGYSRQQWQNMRYKLGLDEKPRFSGQEWARILREKK